MHFSRSLVLVPPFVAAIFLTSLTGCGNGETKPANRQSGGNAMAVDAVILKPQLLEDKIYATGTLLANEEVELRPEISGRVVGVYFEEGKRIKKGELMLKINDRELQAELLRKDPEEKQAADEERRKKGLFDISAISQEEYDKALNSLKMIQAEREIIKSQLAETEIRAPFDGVVGLRHVSEGDYASPSLLVATIQDIDTIKAEFSVPEKYAKDMKPGLQVVVEVGDSEDKYIGTVYAVEAKIDPATRTIKARAIIPNKNETLIPGSFAKVEITLRKIQDAIVIPAGAVIPELNAQKVFIVQGGKAKPVTIQTGIRTDRDIQVTDGLAANDTLITTGLLQIGEGKAVDIRNLESN